MTPLELERVPEAVVKTLYAKDAPHDMYLGEVVEIVDRRAEE